MASASTEPVFDPKLDFGTSKAGVLRTWAYRALWRHRREGTVPTSNRHLFYEAVMAGLIDKSKLGVKASGRRPDQDLTEATTWLRENGHVPWDWIEDRTRHLVDHRGDGDTILEGVDAYLNVITIDPWNVLPILVAESESIAGVLDGVARDYHSLIVPTRGQTNGWIRTYVKDRVGARSVAVGCLGDYDKAGADIMGNSEKVVRDVLNVRSWKTLALTDVQVRRLGLPTVPRTDGRDGVTRDVCEIEALPQRQLLTIVRRFFNGLLPTGVKLADVQVREEAERSAVRGLLGL